MVLNEWAKKLLCYKLKQEYWCCVIYMYLISRQLYVYCNNKTLNIKKKYTL